MGKVSLVKVASGLGCAVVVFGVLGIDYFTEAAYATNALILLLAVGSSLEFCNIMAKKGIFIPRTILVSATVALVLSAALGGEVFLLFVTAPLLAVVLLGTYLLALSREVKASTATDVAFTLTGVLHLGFGFAFFSVLSSLPPGSTSAPYIGWTALFIFVVKANDILGYLLGSKFGRRKLHPISPNKSVEGSLIGLFGGMGISVFVWYLFGLEGFDIIGALAFGLVVGVLAQAGDLAESLLKRFCGVKDSGSIIPASGGFFDFSDCFLLASPAAYLLLRRTVGELSWM